MGEDSQKDDERERSTVHCSRTLCVLEIKLNRNERKEKRESGKAEKTNCVDWLPQVSPLKVEKQGESRGDGTQLHTELGDRLGP